MLTAARRRDRDRDRDRGRARGRDRGSIAVFTAVFALGVLLLLAVLVDGGGALNARERAADIAEQAARAAVTDLSQARLRTGAVAIDWGSACAYAQRTVQAYATAARDVTGARLTHCGQGANARTATVTVRVTTKPVIPGFPAMTMTMTQSAAAVCGNADQQEVC